MVQRSPHTDSSGGSPEAGETDAVFPAPSAEPAAPADEWHRAPTPFVWQHGQRLLLLDDEPPGWVMAELRFDVERCRYIEVRRATYRWAREAVGAILSRALASGDEAIVDSARSLHQWLHKHYGIRVEPDQSAGR